MFGRTLVVVYWTSLGQVRSINPFCYDRTPTLTPSRRLKFAYATPQQLKIIAPGHLRASGVGSLKRLRVSSSPFPLPPEKVFLLAPATVPLDSTLSQPNFTCRQLEKLEFWSSRQL